ncbi:hypothetical protein AN217_16000 [Streptomyces qinglanensis]|uniref:Uncharacterized protein n=1 Tax=Streptomyces qinglanensis TaxID=943816 RepID=A0A1E7K555_9ACTN|nr:hypothetical protein AN217_16000 [Streptomyces qinglanensis]OEV25179.1 hypothetical protein AN220_15275 [Streptomyces nanshensis]
MEPADVTVRWYTASEEPRTVLALAGTSLASVPLAGARCLPAVPAGVPRTGLDDPARKGIAMRLVSSAENSSLDWAGTGSERPGPNPHHAPSTG